MVIDIHAVPYSTGLLFFHCFNTVVFFLKKCIVLFPWREEKGTVVWVPGWTMDHRQEPHPFCKVLCMILSCSIIPCTVTSHMQNKAYVFNTMSHLDVTKTEAIKVPKMRFVSLTVSLD